MMFSFVMSDCPTLERFSLSGLLLIFAKANVCLSIGLWCAGARPGDSGQWRGEGRVEACRADGLRAVKGGSDARIEGPWAPED